MAELVVSFTTQPNGDLSYLIVDLNANLRQLHRFFQEATQMQEFSIIYNNEPVDNDDLLQKIFRSDQSVHFELLTPEAIRAKQSQNQTAPEPEQPKQEPAPKPEPFKLGATLSSIFERFGLEIPDFEVLKACDLANQVPFPVSLLFQQDLPAEALMQLVMPLGMFLQVSPHDLVNDLNALFAYLRTPTTAESQPAEVKPEPEVKREAVPVNHPAFCDNCQNGIQGIRYKCLSCPDYDLCQACEAVNAEQHFHDEAHVFAKMYRSDVPVRGMGFCPRRRGFCGSNPQAPKFPRLEKLEEEVAELKQMLAALNVKKN